MAIPPKGNARHIALQKRYRELLVNLYLGYAHGVPVGGPNINAARNAMVLPKGIDENADRVAQQGFLVAFDLIIDDPRFKPLPKP
jgi:hypothetical protein